MKADSSAEYVLEQLRAHDPAAIESRRMFGSLGLYRDGDFFGILIVAGSTCGPTPRRASNTSGAAWDPSAPTRARP